MDSRASSVPQEEFSHQVVLKSGVIIPMTAAQFQKLGMGIMMAKDFSKVNVKIGEHEFKLSDIEDDPKKLFAIKQQSLKLGDNPQGNRKNPMDKY